jgi:hypothetical protein
VPAYRTPARSRKLRSFITFQISGQARPRRSPRSSLPAVHYPPPTFSLTPLFVALPYISGVSPLSSAFAYFDRWCGGCCLLSAHSANSAPPRYLFGARPLSTLHSRLSALFSAACRLLSLSLQQNTPSLPLFSATYRHFFADRGGGTLLWSPPVLFTPTLRRGRRFSGVNSATASPP